VASDQAKGTPVISGIRILHCLRSLLNKTTLIDSRAEIMAPNDGSWAGDGALYILPCRFVYVLREQSACVYLCEMCWLLFNFLECSNFCVVVLRSEKGVVLVYSANCSFLSFARSIYFCDLLCEKCLLLGAARG